jgi:uncharacterized membrane protein
MHYFPLALPMVMFLFVLFLLLIASIEIGILSYAYQKMGINRKYVFFLLLLSLLGSYINIPIFKLHAQELVTDSYVDFLGMRYIIPSEREWATTLIAINVGGAVIPLMLSVYLTVKNKLYNQALLGIAIVGVLVHLMAYPVRGVGIAVPFFTPPIAATIVAFFLSRRFAPALAYIAGSMGTLLGADITNLDKIGGLGAPVASIGGAGTFDGIFLTGILAVLLAGFLTKSESSASLRSP